jgi:hypothetical protein
MCIYSAGYPFNVSRGRFYTQLRHKSQAPAVKQTEARNMHTVKIFRWAELARNTANPVQSCLLCTFYVASSEDTYSFSYEAVLWL